MMFQFLWVSTPAKYFVNNHLNNVGQDQQLNLRETILAECNTTKWTEKTHTVMGKKKKVSLSSFSIPYRLISQ